jgi:hypothetical protein
VHNFPGVLVILLEKSEQKHLADPGHAEHDPNANNLRHTRGDEIIYQNPTKSFSFAIGPKFYWAFNIAWAL